MKKPNVLLIQHGKPLAGFTMARLRPILEMIDLQVEFCTGGNVRQLLSSLIQNPPDLVIVDRPLPAASSPPARDRLRHCPLGCPQIVLSEEKALLRSPVPDMPGLEFPLDVIALHGLLGQCLTKYPRKHLRLPVHLPCVFTVRGFCSFGDILSLGTGGAFIKAPCRHLQTGDCLDVGVPLLGMKKELEVRSRVVYLQTPKAENNYLQGAGVEFLAPEGETISELEAFLRLSLLDEISPIFTGFGLPGQQPGTTAGPAVAVAEGSPRQHLRV